MDTKKMNTTEETLLQFLQKVGVDDLDKAPGVLDELLTMLLAQKRALESLGIVTMVVVERGIFQLQISPNLSENSSGLDALDAAVADLQRTVIRLRKRFMEKELEKVKREANPTS